MSSDENNPAVNAAVSPDAPGEAVTPVEVADLRAKAIGIIERALDEGSVDVALGVLALNSAAARPAKRRTWVLASLGILLLLGLVGGVLAYQSMSGGTSGDNAPPPMALGALDSQSTPLVATSDTDATSNDPAAGVAADGTPTDPAVATEVLGTSLTAPGAPSSGALGAAGTPGTPAAGGLKPLAGAKSSTPSAAGVAPANRAPGAAPTPAGSTAAGAAPTTAPAAAATTAAPRVGALDGNWAAARGSIAGYRVSKTWFTGQTDEVVGRTQGVSAAMSIASDSVTGATIVIDMASIDSGEALRDLAFRNDLLQTAAYPDARFELTAPISIAARPAPGGVLPTKAAGRLKVHGVVRDVVVDLQAQQNGNQIQVVGSIPVVFADFGVPNPDIGLAKVSDRGTIEFSIAFGRA